MFVPNKLVKYSAVKNKRWKKFDLKKKRILSNMLQIHQPFMALTLILTAVAFVLVFVAVRDYSQVTLESAYKTDVLFFFVFG